MKQLIIKGIELDLFNYTDGQGFSKSITDVDLLVSILTDHKHVTETVLRNMVNAMQYVKDNKMRRYIILFLHFTNPRKGGVHKLQKCNQTFIRGGVKTPTNCNQTNLFEKPFSISRYNDCFLPGADTFHVYNGSDLVRA